MKIMRETGPWRWIVMASTDRPGKEKVLFRYRTFRADDRAAADHLVLALIRQDYSAKVIDKQKGEEA